jgi:cytochrome P450
MSALQAEEIDFSKVASLGDDLIVQLNSLREEAPISWNDKEGCWIVTRHNDCMLAFNGKVPVSNKRWFPDDLFKEIPVEQRHTELPLLTSIIPLWIINVDNPEHARIRRLVRDSFDRGVVESMREFARSVINEELERAAHQTEVDFVDDIAVRITARVMLRLLGMPEALIPNLRRWSYDMNAVLGSARTKEIIFGAERAMREMKDLLEPKIAERKNSPREDFLTHLVRAEADGGLSHGELVGMCFITLMAGFDTTANTMTLGLRSLLKYPDQIKFMLYNPDSIGNSVMEIMRHAVMTAAQPRRVTEDFDWHGEKIRAGDFIYLMVASANRDPRVFPEPEKLDLARRTDQSLVFGRGAHHCIGHLLAKMQLSEFFPAFFTRFPEARIIENDPAFLPVLIFRGVEHLRVRLSLK